MKKTGASVLVVSRSTGRILFGLRSKFCRCPMTWAEFGGGREPGDRDLEATALRELAEETGYTGPIELHQLAWVDQTGFRAVMFLGIVPEEFEPDLNEEHIRAQWFWKDEIEDLKLHPLTRRLLMSASA